MNKIKLLYITARADHGGGPRHLDLLINNLSDKFEVYVACPPDEPYYSFWKQNPFVLKVLQIPHRKFTVSGLSSLYAFIKDNNIKIVHSQGKGAGIYSRTLKLLVPSLSVVHTFHGVHISEYNRLQKSIYILIERLAGKLTEKFINVSKGERDICLSLGFSTERKTSVIYNGIPTPIYSKAVKEGEFIVTSITRFDYAKNMQLAFSIAKALPSLKFCWVGDGPERKSIEEQAFLEQVKNISFAGFQDNPMAFLAQTSVYLSTSRWEGLPISLLEASSLGIPIIATNVTGNNEVVAHDFNGMLYDQNNPETAVKHLETLYNNRKLYHKMSENALSTFYKKFRLEIMVAKTESIYNSIR